MLLVARPEWMDRKACTPDDTNDMCLFPSSRPNAADRAAIARALSICASCPVRAECADWAIHLPTGQRIVGSVIGGMTPGELNRARGTAEAKEERLRRYRYRCGTPAAYDVHRQRGEICTICLEANAARNHGHAAA